MHSVSLVSLLFMTLESYKGVISYAVDRAKKLLSLADLGPVPVSF